MQLIPLQTNLLLSLEDLFANLLAALKATHLTLKNDDILAVSSKLFSYAEGRIKPDEDFKSLVKQEADLYYEGNVVDLTRKHGLWVANSGIDRSNVKDGSVILWPVDPQKSVDKLREQIVQHFKLQNVGVMMIDSICAPGRVGVTGATIAYQGFIGVKDERGKLDIFENPLKITRVNVADSLAATTNLLMGEANEMTPYCIVRESGVTFAPSWQDSIALMSLALQDCIFNPIYKL